MSEDHEIIGDILGAACIMALPFLLNFIAYGMGYQ